MKSMQNDANGRKTRQPTKRKGVILSHSTLLALELTEPCAYGWASVVYNVDIITTQLFTSRKELVI